MANISLKKRKLIYAKRYQRTTGRRYKLPSRKTMRNFIADSILSKLFAKIDAEELLKNN